MNNKTYSIKANEIEKKWYILDASDKPLGRVATEAARLLRGKHKPTFTPNLDNGDHVIIINSDKAILTGDKLNQKMHRTHSRFPGGVKEISYKVMMEKSSDKVFLLAIKGMLPGNSLGRKILTNVRVYKDAEHNHEAQKPEMWNF